MTQRVKIRVTADMGKVSIEVGKKTALILTAEAAMELADDLTRAAEPTLLMKAVA